MVLLNHSKNMKKHLLFALLGVLAFCSCSNSLDMLENDLELEKATANYETSVISMAEIDTAKIETVADEATIQKVMDDYVIKLMDRASIGKEKLMRTVYSSVEDVVGVFKVGSCGVYKELEVYIDAEDKRSKSRTVNSVGDSFVDKNGNVHLKFCLTEASQYYPGGVFLVDHINYKSGQDPFSNNNAMDVVVRYHDCEDKGSDNRVSGTHPKYYNRITISNGYTKIDDNAALAWAFPNKRGVPSMICSSNLGPKSQINYGLLSGSRNANMGRIYIDDEDNSNKNWVKLYSGRTFVKNLATNREYWEYGITTGDNTWYNITLNTDLNYFKNNNFFHPARVTYCK